MSASRDARGQPRFWSHYGSSGEVAVGVGTPTSGMVADGRGVGSTVGLGIGVGTAVGVSVG